MSPARIVLTGLCVAAMLRFLVTPVAPCGAVALGALAVLAWVNAKREEDIRDVRWAVEEAKREQRDGEKLVAKVTGEVVDTLRKDLDETRARVDALAGRRAFGGP